LEPAMRAQNIAIPAAFFLVLALMVLATAAGL
jgi:hypothetical protein